MSKEGNAATNQTTGVKMILHITSAKYIEDYKIEVAFNDGRHGVADLSSALHGPVFKPLKDKNFFAQLKIDDQLETITWPNGADLAPEYVYYRAFINDPKLQVLFKKWGYKS